MPLWHKNDHRNEHLTGIALSYTRISRDVKPIVAQGVGNKIDLKTDDCCESDFLPGTYNTEYPVIKSLQK